MSDAKPAHLTVATDRRVRPEGCEEVTARTLRELRRALRERVELKGAWWA